MIRIAGRALGRALSVIVIAIATQLISLPDVSAQNFNNAPVIFDVRRSLPLEPNEPVYHDFYINAGPESGLKKGMYVTVVRPVPVHDPIQNKQQATLNVTVGKLQVLQVDRGITVARLNSELSDEERPVLEFEAIMIGDRIDLDSATTVAPKPTNKKKPRVSAERESAPSAPVADSDSDESSISSAESQIAGAQDQSPESGVENLASTEPTSPAPQNLAMVTRPLAQAAPLSIGTAGNADGSRNVNPIGASSGVPENASPAASRAGMVRIPVPGPAGIANRAGASSPQKQPQSL